MVAFLNYLFIDNLGYSLYIICDDQIINRERIVNCRFSRSQNKNGMMFLIQVFKS